MKNEDPFGIKEVVANDCCVGCGACASRQPEEAEMVLTDGLYQARLGSKDKDLLDQVCPFSDFSRDEDALAEEFLVETTKYSEGIGNFRALFAGRVADDGYRVGSSSGGLVSWLAARLLDTGAVDGVIHVKATDGPGEPLFEFGVSTTIDEILANRKSVYYPVEFSAALQSARELGGKFAFVGIPCHVKALRLLQRQDGWLREHVTTTIGLVCGHLKSTGFGESFGWQLGIEPTNLLSIDFRVKDAGAPANRYRFAAVSASDGTRRETPSSDLVGSNWGHGFFQPNACNYCDDIFAETADVSLGDAWLPRYEEDSMGNNVVVVRSSLPHELLLNGVSDGVIRLESLDVDEVKASQSGNFRHRRVGLSVRSADDDAVGRPRPSKRVEPGYASAGEKRISIVRMRRDLSRLSFEAFSEAKRRNDLRVFFDRMDGPVRKYDKFIATSLQSKGLAHVPLRYQRIARRLVRRVRSLGR